MMNSIEEKEEDSRARLRSEGEHVDVVVRCRNEMPYTERTLRSLASQRHPEAHVWFFDCGSSDGSKEAAARAGATVIDIDPSAYIPGAILNQAMMATRSDLVAFVNADAVPLSGDALARLLAPFEEDEHLCATFGRQVARPDADRGTRLDYERAFGTSPLSTRRGTFFSMAASAIRRRAWRNLPFDAALHYSEDVDWTHRMRALGWGVRYVADALFEHSHAYTLGGHFRRRFGEGAADSLIYRLGQPSLLSDALKPAAGSMLRDWQAYMLSPSLALARCAQAAGYFMGRRAARFEGARR